MNSTQHILILGTGAAGAAAARSLAGREDLRVTLVGETGVTPYTRMLIKGIAFGVTPPDMIKIPLPEVDLVSDTVVEVDTGSQEVQLASGRRLNYDAVIVATGSIARPLPANITGGSAFFETGRVSALHSIEDALHIRDLLAGLGRPARVAIYGGGIIAAESASSLREAGHSVMLINRSAIPGVGAFGAPVAERLAVEHSSRVLTRFGRTIQHIDVSDGGVAITLDNDSSVTADLLLLALGTAAAAPAPWTDGIEVDDRLRAKTAHVYAAGGVATHHDDALGTWRIDHWDDASAQGAHAAQVALHELGLADDPGAYLPRSPYMAMVYGQMITGVGYLGDADTHVEDGEEFVVRHEQAGTVIGVTGIDAVGTVYQWGQRLHGVRA